MKKQQKTVWARVLTSVLSLAMIAAYSLPIGFIPVKTAEAGNTTVTGTVVQPGGGELNSDLECSGPPEGQIRAEIVIYTHDNSFREQVDTECDGTFSMENVIAGDLFIQARAINGEFTDSAERSISVPGSGTMDAGNVEFTTAQVAGTVTYQGQPVENAGIDVFKEDWSERANGHTNALGEYTVGGLTPGSYFLELRVPWDGGDGMVAPARQEITITDSVQTKNLEFTEATKFIRVCVKRQENNNAVTDARVEANKGGGGSHTDTNVGDDGCGTLPVTRGSWDVRTNPATQDGTSNWVYSGFGESVSFKNDDSRETKTVTLKVITTDATVTGRVVRPNGSPVGNAHVDLRTQDGIGMGGPAQQDGHFSFPAKSGTYRVGVWVDDPGLMFPERQVTIRKGDNNLGTIKAQEKKARINGKVMKKDGTPLNNIRLNAFKHGGSGWSNVTSGNDGRFSIPATKGRWGVNVDEGGPGGDDQEPQRWVYDGPPLDVDIPDEEATVSVGNIKLTYADATIEGSVVDEDGNSVGVCSYAYATPASGTAGEVGDGHFGPHFGGPVDCQSGRFSINLPSSVASTFILGMHTPPDSEYAALGEQEVTVLANSTVSKNIRVARKDATVRGKLIDQNGNDVESCKASGDKGWFGDVFMEAKGMGWNGTQIKEDCTYRLTVLGGRDYRFGHWIEPGNGFMEKHPSPDPVSIPRNANKEINVHVIKADATISGTLKDPDGNGTRGFVFAGNWPELDAGGGEFKFEDELFSGTETGEDGSFQLDVITNHRYEVNAGAPPELGFMSPKSVEVDMTDGSKDATVNLQLRQALGAMTGSVSLYGDPVRHGFVHCWAEDGGFTGGEVDYDGNYRVNYVEGDWHCGADSFNGSDFFRSNEEIISITDQTSISQDFALSTSSFTLPPPVTVTFDASQAKTITLENGTTIFIPAGALSDEQENVTVIATPTINLFHTKDTQPFGVGYELKAYSSTGSEITSFNQDVTITFYYTDAQLEEVGVSEDSLISKYYDEASGTWKSPAGISQDKEENSITISTNHFTTFSVVTGQGGLGTNVPYKIITGAGVDSGPQVHVYDEDTQKNSTFFAYDQALRTGVNVAAGDLNGDGTVEIVTAPAGNGGPHIKVFTKDGELLSSFMAFPVGFRGGVTVATGDTNGDGRDSIIVAPAAGGGPQVKIFDENANLLSTFMAYDSSLRMGINLGVADTEGDGKERILVSPGEGYGSQVKIFDEDTELVSNFFAFPSTLRCGAYPTSGDLNGDGADEIIVGAGQGCGPQVHVFDKEAVLISTFMAFDSHLRTGAKVAAGDMNTDGDLEIITAPGRGGGPHVRVYAAEDARELMNFFPYPSHLRVGTNIASGAL